MTESQINAYVQSLQAQRNGALNTLAEIDAQLTVARAENAALQAQLETVKAKLSAAETAATPGTPEAIPPAAA